MGKDTNANNVEILKGGMRNIGMDVISGSLRMGNFLRGFPVWILG